MQKTVLWGRSGKRFYFEPEPGEERQRSLAIQGNSSSKFTCVASWASTPPPGPFRLRPKNLSVSGPQTQILSVHIYFARQYLCMAWFFCWCMFTLQSIRSRTLRLWRGSEVKLAISPARTHGASLVAHPDVLPQVHYSIIYRSLRSSSAYTNLHS